MWISRKYFNELESKVNISINEKVQAEKYHDLIQRASQGALIITDNDVYCMSRDTFSAIVDEKLVNESTIRELEAKLAWYQNKYQELKMKLEETP